MARGRPYRWAVHPTDQGPWWLLYAPDPTGYAIETHFVRWDNAPDALSVAPMCAGLFDNGTCPGADPGQSCT